jgi:hypothetical protein
MEALTYLQSLAYLGPLGGILVARTLGDVCGPECVVHLFERAFEVQDVLGVA